MGKRFGTPDEHFWFYVNKKNDNECWGWTGPRERFGKYVGQGYGVFAHDSIRYRAHRYSYELHTGKIPDGYFCLHRCVGRPDCVNPAHLYFGSQLDNMRDRSEQDRCNIPNGINHHKALLSDLEVRAIRALHAAKFFQFEIAKLFGTNQSRISYIVRHENYPDSSVDKDSIRFGRLPAVSEELIETMYAAYKAGASVRSLSRQHKVSESTIWRRFRSKGK